MGEVQIITTKPNVRFLEDGIAIAGKQLCALSLTLDGVAGNITAFDEETRVLRLFIVTI